MLVFVIVMSPVSGGLSGYSRLELSAAASPFDPGGGGGDGFQAGVDAGGEAN